MKFFSASVMHSIFDVNANQRRARIERMSRVKEDKRKSIFSTESRKKEKWLFFHIKSNCVYFISNRLRKFKTNQTGNEMSEMDRIEL